MKRFFIVVSFFAILLLNYSFIPEANFLGRSEVTFKEITVEGMYTIKVPDYLHKDSLLSPVKAMQYSSLTEDVFVTIEDRGQNEFRNEQIFNGIYNYKLTPFENFAKTYLGETKSLFDTLTSESKLMLRNTWKDTIRYYEFSGYVTKGDKKEYSCTMTFYRGKDNFYSLFTMAPTRTLYRYEQDLDHMVMSFKELSEPNVGGMTDYFINFGRVYLRVPRYFEYDSLLNKNALFGFSGLDKDIFMTVSEDSISTWSRKSENESSKNTKVLDFFAKTKSLDVKNTLPNSVMKNKIVSGTAKEKPIRSFTITTTDAQKVEWTHKYMIMQGQKVFYTLEIWLPTDQLYYKSWMIDHMVSTFDELYI